jgi:ribonucleoside-diphosphate reductase alpha chain
MSGAVAETQSPGVTTLQTVIGNLPVEGKEAGRWTRVFTKKGVHPFDDIEWKIANAKIVNPKGETVFEQKGVEVPAWWGQTTINIVADKYFRIVDGKREWSVKQIFARVTKKLREWANEERYFNSEKDAEVFESELLYALLHQFGAFNSPVWFNLGVPDRRQAASACFISGVDDTVESIMQFQQSEATIFCGGSGSGANMSSIRSSYERLSSGALVCGPVGWMEGFDKYAKSFKSGGSTRNAAKMVVLDMDHPDILRTQDGRPGFITCKAVEEKRAHDLIDVGYSSAYDDPNSAYKWVSYQNANHSVSVPDTFMHAVEGGLPWETKERLTGETVHDYDARELWSEVAKAAWFCGDPGVQFTDTINKWHTTPESGRIKSSNPCSEFLHVDNTACNLCAINLTKFFDGRKFLADRFEQSVRLFVTAQNAIVGKAEYPTEAITEGSFALRPIGLNYGNLGSLLMRLGYGYDSDEGRAIAAQMASFMTGLAYSVSAKLAARTQPFPEFEKNKRSMLGIMRMHQEADASVLAQWSLLKDPLDGEVLRLTAEVWKDVISLGEKFGYTISQATLQAPLGTISFLMGMDTTGIEPAFSLVTYKSLVGGGKMKLVNGTVRDALNNLGYRPADVEETCKYIEDNGYIEGAPGLLSDHLPVFDCAMSAGPSKRHLTPLAHLRMMAAIQPLITCAMSKTVNLEESTTPEEIADLYMEGWKLGLKCVALYRDGCKKSQPLSTNEEKPKTLLSTGERRHMPEDCQGHRHRFEIDGHKGYIVMNEYPDGKLGEVFLKFGKNGSTMGGLIDGFTQLLSVALQYGVPLDKLVRSFIHTKFEPSGFRAIRIHQESACSVRGQPLRLSFQDSGYPLLRRGEFGIGCPSGKAGT